MAKKAAGKPSIVTWIWLWGALKLLMEYYPRALAERMLVREIAARRVRRKRIPPADGHDLRIWKRLAGKDDPQWDPQVLQVLHPVIHWEESTVEAYWRGSHRAYREKIVREDVLR